MLAASAALGPTTRWNVQPEKRSKRLYLLLLSQHCSTKGEDGVTEWGA